MAESDELIKVAVENKTVVDDIDRDFENIESPTTKYRAQMAKLDKRVKVRTDSIDSSASKK